MYINVPKTLYSEAYHGFILITFMSVYEMDPRVKPRGIFKTKKHIDLRLMALDLMVLRLMALGEKIT